MSQWSVVRGVSGVSGEGCLRGQRRGVSQGSVERGVSGGQWQGVFQGSVVRGSQGSVVIASTPGPLTFVSSWRAWFATTTWGRIEVEPTSLGVGSPQSHHDNGLQPPGISVVERSEV